MDTNKKNDRGTSDRITPGRDLKDYVESRIELFSITIAEEIANTISASIQKFVGIIFLSLGAVFLWIALGFFLSELLNSQSLGFLIASLPLVFIGFILYNRTSKTLEEKIQLDIIRKISIESENESSRNSANDNRILTDEK